jgi:flagellar biosynthesis protein FlhA
MYILVSTIFLTLIILIVPISSVILDGLIITYWILCLCLFIVAIESRKELYKKIPGFPTILLAITLFGLGLTITTVRVIPVKAIEPDSFFINTAVKMLMLIFKIENPAFENSPVPVIIFCVYIAIVLTSVYLISRTSRIAKAAQIFTRERLMDIAIKWKSAGITESEYQLQKHDFYQASDFYGTMDGVRIFTLGNVTVGIIISMATTLGGFLVEAIKSGRFSCQSGTPYLLFSVGTGLVFLPPNLVLAAISTHIVSEANKLGFLKE